MKWHKNDRVSLVLELFPDTRKNDRLLLIKVWEAEGLVLDDVQRSMILGGMVSNPESIRRTRQMIQAKGKYLPDKSVEQYRDEIEHKTRYNINKTEPNPAQGVLNV